MPRSWNAQVMKAISRTAEGLALIAVVSGCMTGQTNFASVPGLHAPWENELGMKFVPVPGTSVLFSSWETRVRDFAAFVEATGHIAVGNVYSLDAADGQWKVHPSNYWQAPGFEQTPNHPVVNVSWSDATEFCRWLTRRDRATGAISAHQEYRLPSDVEWSAAAGPTTYPWGEQWPPTSGNYFGTEQQNPKRPIIDNYDDGATHTAEVGRYAANAYGLHDLGGNAWEWVNDFYRKEMNSDELRKELIFLDLDEGGAKLRVLRGGGWVDAQPSRLANAFHSFGRPTNRYCVGFRVVLAETEGPPQ
jgi:formylglycine-generating enzyme required for sulfatase activity